MFIAFGCVHDAGCKKVIWPRNSNELVNPLEAKAKEIITQELYIVDANVLVNPWYLKLLSLQEHFIV